MAQATSSAPLQGLQQRRPPWSALALLLCATMGLGWVADWRDAHLFLINTTQSLPNWAFLIRRGGTPKPGDYVFFKAPRTWLVVRHFGDRPRIFGKIVYGAPGDNVSHDGQLVRINGLPVGRMKSRTHAGERLTPGHVGRIPAHCYYVGSPHPDGFDSRYADIGFVCAKQLVGIGTAVL